MKKILLIITALYMIIPLTKGQGYAPTKKYLVAYYDSNTERYGYLDLYTDNVLIQPGYDVASNEFTDGYAAVGFRSGTDGWGSYIYKWGLIDEKGSIVVPAKYKYISNQFSNGLVIFQDQNDKYGYLDLSGIRINAEFDDADTFSEGLASVQRYGKWAFINKDGRLITGFDYDSYYAFSQGLAGVRKNGKWGFINADGKEITPFIYDQIQPFSSGYATAMRNDRYGFISRDGKEASAFIYELAYPFCEGRASVKLNGKWGFLDESLKTVVEPKYDKVNRFSEGLAVVSSGNKCGFINLAGQLVVPLKYDEATSFSNGYASIMFRDKAGFLDKTFKETFIPLDGVVFLGEFHDGLARINAGEEDFLGMGNGLWGYVDTYGRVVISPRYEEAFNFKNGFAVILIDMEEYYINKQGEIVF